MLLTLFMRIESFPSIPSKSLITVSPIIMLEDDNPTCITRHNVNIIKQLQSGEVQVSEMYILTIKFVTDYKENIKKVQL